MKIRFIVKKLGKMMAALPVALVLVCSQTLMGQTVAFKNATEAIQAAQEKGQYLFLLFYDKRAELYYDNSEELFKEMKIAIDDFRNKSSEKILFQKVLITDDKEKDIVSKYKIQSSRLPELLILAPNGAVTGLFPKRVTAQNFAQSIVSKLTMAILKSIQKEKMALVLMQNNSTKYNNESSKAAEEFANDPRIKKGTVDIIKADPADNEVKKFLAQIKEEKPISESTVVLIASPGSVTGVYSGIDIKEKLLGLLPSSSAASSTSVIGSKCGTGAGSSGGCCGSK